jgi:hypothetical protein
MKIKAQLTRTFQTQKKAELKGKFIAISIYIKKLREISNT